MTGKRNRRRVTNMVAEFDALCAAAKGVGSRLDDLGPFGEQELESIQARTFIVASEIAALDDDDIEVVVAKARVAIEYLNEDGDFGDQTARSALLSLIKVASACTNVIHLRP